MESLSEAYALNPLRAGGFAQSFYKIVRMPSFDPQEDQKNYLKAYKILYLELTVFDTHAIGIRPRIFR